MELLNNVRAYYYLAHVLSHQQQDLFCGRCSAWNNTLNNTRKAFEQFETEHVAGINALSLEANALLAETRIRLNGLVNTVDPAGQKTAGNCTLPKGVCFVKGSRNLAEQATGMPAPS
jgi:hypothetical protein